MNDYMKALHQRFYREPDFSEMEEDIEKTRRRYGTAWTSCSDAGSCIWWTRKTCCGRRPPWPASPLDSNWPGN